MGHIYREMHQHNGQAHTIKDVITAFQPGVDQQEPQTTFETQEEII